MYLIHKFSKDINIDINKFDSNFHHILELTLNQVVLGLITVDEAVGNALEIWLEADSNS